jgi:hypothetical protein
VFITVAVVATVVEITEVDMVVEIMGIITEIISKAGGNIHLSKRRNYHKRMRKCGTVRKVL